MPTTVKKLGTRKQRTFKNSQASVAAPKSFGDSFSVEEKLKILDDLGQADLVTIFKDWKPRQTRRPKTAPLDQRVAVTVTAGEKLMLDKELQAVRAAGETITTSEFIRNRAMASVDINGWAELAEAGLKELEALENGSQEARQRRKTILTALEEVDDPEDRGSLERELSTLNRGLDRLIAKNEKRVNRLTGRMTMADAEVIKWRALRLSVSTSDYLRLMIFSLFPNSAADAHLSLDAKRRFYVSIIDVARNGWGENPTTYNCKACASYLEEIDVLRDRVRQLESFM